MIYNECFPSRIQSTGIANNRYPLPGSKNATMPRKPLWIILGSGFLTFLMSTGLTYWWATSSPTNSHARSVGNNPPPPVEETRASTGNPPDTQALSPRNWEAFLEYEGERVSMLGIKKKYAETVVNVRRGPGMEFRVVATSPGGELLIRLDRFNEWYRARLPDGTIGWIHKSLVRLLNVPRPVYRKIQKDLPPLRKSTLATIPGGFFQHNRVKVTRSIVNLRRGPGTQFEIAGRAYRYERLRLMAKQRRWYRVKSPAGYAGWVREDLVKPIWIRSRSEQEKLTIKTARVRLGPQFQFREQSRTTSVQDVRELESNPPWHQVRFPDGNIGWIHEQELIQSPQDRTE